MKGQTDSYVQQWHTDNKTEEACGCFNWEIGWMGADLGDWVFLLYF